MTRPTTAERLTLQSCSAAAVTNSTTPPPSINSVGTGCDWISSSWSKLGMLDVSLGSGTINCAIEASKWRRYWVWVVAAGSIATRKAAQAQDRSHFGVPSGFDRFCSGSRRQSSVEHTSELQTLMRISYAVFCMNKNKKHLSYTT